MIGRSRSSAAVARRVGDAESPEPQLVRVRDVDHRRLHRHAEQREEADPRRHRERRARERSASSPPSGAESMTPSDGDERELEVAGTARTGSTKISTSVIGSTTLQLRARRRVLLVLAAPPHASSPAGSLHLARRPAAARPCTALARSRPSTEYCTPM